MKQSIKTATLRTTWNKYPAGTLVRIEHDTKDIFRAWASFSKNPKTLVGDIPKSLLSI